MALGKLVDALDGDDTFCVEVRAALGKLVSALVGAALGKLVSAIDGDDTVCVEFGAALGKLITMKVIIMFLSIDNKFCDSSNEIIYFAEWNAD